MEAETYSLNLLLPSGSIIHVAAFTVWVPSTKVRKLPETAPSTKLQAVPELNRRDGSQNS